MTSLSALRSVSATAMRLVGTLFLIAAMTSFAAAQPLRAPVAHISLELNKGRLIALDHPAASVFVADPDIADVQVKSPRLVYVFARKPGETTLYAVDSTDKVVEGWTLSVSHNLTRLREAIHEYIPDARVQVSSLGDAVVLQGVVRSAETSEDVRALAARLAGKGNVINRLSVRGPNQINLRVRIAEVHRSVLKQIGVNWDAFLSAGALAFGIGTGNPVAAAASGTAGAGIPIIKGQEFLTRNAPAIGTGNTDSIFGGLRTSHWNVNTLIDALENEGLVTVLAEPNLTAVSGETASFLAGGEFPIPVAQANNTISVEFKKFGVSLSFTPTLLSDGRIALKVRPEVSQLTTNGEVQFNGFTIPAIATRRAETSVELGSGQSFAIAGLLQNDLNRAVRRLPGLGDLPILGALFRSDAFQRDESELVIIVTPYVVKPTSATAMAAPTDGLKMPSDLERLKRAPLYEQHLNPDQPVAHGTEGRNLIGQAGFTLE